MKMVKVRINKSLRRKDLTKKELTVISVVWSAVLLFRLFFPDQFHASRTVVVGYVALILGAIYLPWQFYKAILRLSPPN